MYMYTPGLHSSRPTHQPQYLGIDTFIHPLPLHIAPGQLEAQGRQRQNILGDATLEIILGQDREREADIADGVAAEDLLELGVGPERVVGPLRGVDVQLLLDLPDIGLPEGADGEGASGRGAAAAHAEPIPVVPEGPGSHAAGRWVRRCGHLETDLWHSMADVWLAGEEPVGLTLRPAVPGIRKDGGAEHHSADRERLLFGLWLSSEENTLRKGLEMLEWIMVLLDRREDCCNTTKSHGLTLTSQ